MQSMWSKKGEPEQYCLGQRRMFQVSSTAMCYQIPTLTLGE